VKGPYEIMHRYRGHIRQHDLCLHFGILIAFSAYISAYAIVLVGLQERRRLRIRRGAESIQADEHALGFEAVVAISAVVRSHGPKSD
jgi:hypothetical protein